MVNKKSSYLLPMLLFPISFFNFPVLGRVPGGDGNLALIFYVGVFFYLGFVRNMFTEYYIDSKTLQYLLILISAQTIVCVMSANSYQGYPGFPSLPATIFNLVNTIFNIFIAFEVCHVVLKDELDLEYFFKGLIAFLILFLVIVLIPQVIGTFTSSLDSFLNFLGSHFELQHAGRADFYQQGSYVTTLRRVNGFSKEASFLAAQIGICFIPFILAMLVTEYRLFFAKKDNWLIKHQNAILLVCLLIVLLFAKTTTGILVDGLTIIIVFFIGIYKNWKRTLLIVLPIIGVFLLLYFFLPWMRDLLNSYLLAKQGTENRMQNTLALISIFLKHPLFGIGFNMSSPYVMNLIPPVRENNLEYLYYFSTQGYATQSILAAFLATMGLVGLLPIVYFIGKKICRAVVLIKRTSSNVQVTILLAFILTILYFAIFSLFTFAYTDFYFIVLIATYLQAIYVFRKE